MSEDKTIRSGEGEIISSGAGSTEKGSGGIISSGVQPGVSEGGQIISSGVQAPSVVVVGNEIILNGEKYVILQRLGASGEAELFLARRGKGEFVLKIYYPKFAPKMEVVQQLKGLLHPDIIAVIDYGFYQDRFVEVMEYARGGSLYDVIPIRDPKRLKQIVSEVVNALHFCHSNGVIHRDIKPQNLFFRDASKTDVVVGDFGISSVLDEGFSKRLTGQARTMIYAAPELFQSIQGKVVIDKAIDYYALGITLIHLWTGQDPFIGLGDYGMMRMKMEGRIAIPEDMPREFQTLVKGLITVNPAKRWGYDEVQRWLRGEVVPVEDEIVKEYPLFIFGRVGGEELVATDPVSLADLMEQYEDLGKRHLYKKAISEWLKGRDQFLYTSIESIVEDEYPKDQQAGLIKAIYVLDPNRPFKGVDGKLYETPEELAQCLEANFSHYKEDLKRPNSPFYLYLEARGYKSEADKFRDLFKNVASSEAALNTLILSLEGGDTLRINGHIFREPEGLLAAPEPVRQRLVNDLANPYSKFSLWLQRYPELARPIRLWRSLKRFDTVSFRYALNGGALLGGSVLREPEDVKDLLWEHPELFDHAAVEELNYWLRYYKEVSFNELVLEVMNHAEGEKALTLALCALHNCEDRRLDVFQTLKQILTIFGTRSTDASFPPESFTQLSEGTARAIEDMVRRKSQQGDPVSFLEQWLAVLETQAGSAHFWEEVVSRLPANLFIPLAQAVDDNSRVRFGEAYERLTNKLTSLAVTGSLKEKLLKEREFFHRELDKREKSIELERQVKRLTVETSYTKLILQRTAEAKNANKETYEKMIWTAIIFVIFAVTAVGVISGSEFGYYVGLPITALGLIFGGAYGGLVGAIAGLFLGVFVGALVAALSPVIALAALVFFLIYGHKYRRAISEAARLTPEEEGARRESLERIDEYYREKAREERAKLVVQAILEA